MTETIAKPMIDVQGLGKNYGDVEAVKGVDFTAAQGSIFGLLGPNGAGKSTTIGCLSGLHKPSRGRVVLLGHDVATEPIASRRELGTVPQELALYDELNARENLRYWGAIYGLRGGELDAATRDTLERIGLTDRATQAVNTMSGGMKRRLNFGCGVMHRPRVLLLDEPTVGVDPQSRERILDLVRELRDSGTCVLYTSHYMEEAEALCDRLAIIDHGSILAQGTLAELREAVGERDVLQLVGSFDATAVRAAVVDPERWPVPGTEVLIADDESLTLALDHASRHLPAIFEALSRLGATIRETTLKRPSLESLFLHLTGRELRQ